MREKIVVASAALVIMTAASGALARPRPALERLVKGQLADVRSGLDRLCAPHCGEVVLESSLATRSAALEHVSAGLSRVLYNHGFIGGVARRYGTPAVYGMLAHEYGHHLDDVSGASQWTRELRADAMAGCALARGGLPSGPILAWMRHEHLDTIWSRLHPDETDPNHVLRRYTSDHPPWLDRIGALKRGVEVCRADDGALLLREFVDRSGTRAVEFTEMPSFAEQPFTMGTSTLALGANADGSLGKTLRFDRYGSPPASAP
jgi:hypothetical protein